MITWLRCAWCLNRYVKELMGDNYFCSSKCREEWEMNLYDRR